MNNEVVDRRLKVVYIVGAQRGGTTILARVLGSLEGFVFGGELRRIWTLIGRGGLCGCGQPYSRCSVWSSILDKDGSFQGLHPNEIERLQRRVAPSGHSWWRTWRLLRSATITPEEERYLSLTGSLYRALAEQTDADVLIDSSKIPIEPALLLHARDITFFCVHVVRDPRGAVFAAHLGRGETIEETARILSQDRSRSAAPKEVQLWRTLKTSAGWCTRHSASAAVRRRYGVDRGLLVRYEDFVRDPRGVLSRICSLVGRASDVQTIEPDAMVLPTVHNASRTGRPMAGEVALREDNRWERDLNAVDRGVTSALTFPVARRYGYMGGRARRWEPADREARPR